MTWMTMLNLLNLKQLIIIRSVLTRNDIISRYFHWRPVLLLLQLNNIPNHDGSDLLMNGDSEYRKSNAHPYHQSPEKWQELVDRQEAVQGLLLYIYKSDHGNFQQGPVQCILSFEALRSICLGLGKMKTSVILAVAVIAFISASQFVVDANFIKSTRFTWGAYHSVISNNGNDLQLQLDRTAGKLYQPGFLWMSLFLRSNNINVPILWGSTNRNV